MVGSARVNVVHAQVDICDFIGPICQAIFNTTDPDFSGGGAAGSAQTFITSRLGLILSLVFVAIILIAVFVIIRASIKYIQSQGNEEQIADATKAIKSVFIGIAALFVGVLGMVLVAAFFGGLSFFEPAGGGSGDACRIQDGRLVCGDLE